MLESLFNKVAGLKAKTWVKTGNSRRIQGDRFLSKFQCQSQVSSRNTRKRREICFKLMIKTPERPQ